MKLELRSVRIKNCGPIDDIKIDFFDASGKTLPVCVIGGANGSGKTTVLEVIAAMAEMLIPKSLDTLDDHQVQKAPDFLAKKKSEYLQMDFLVGGKEMSLFYGVPPTDARLHEEKCGWGKGPYPNTLMPEDTGFAIEIRQRIGMQQGIPSKYPASDLYVALSDLVPSIIYLPHNRSLEPVSPDQIQKEADAYKFVQRIEVVRQFWGSLTSYLIWLEYSDTERFEQMRKFLNDLDFDGKTFHVNRKELDVFVKTKDGHEHRLHELSSGEQNLLIILIELYRKLLPGSIVLIDEIENSLHPAYQHRLAQGLLALQKEIPYQLIVTTHAPVFVEIFSAENTRVLTPF
ncbi:MAG: AAA family ATPase [Acidobacteria bacterium]|nr:AAA family ATPase [Acidobacteriota bacterium]